MEAVSELMNKCNWCDGVCACVWIPNYYSYNPSLGNSFSSKA